MFEYIVNGGYNKGKRVRMLSCREFKKLEGTRVIAKTYLNKCRNYDICVRIDDKDYVVELFKKSSYSLRNYLGVKGFIQVGTREWIAVCYKSFPIIPLFASIALCISLAGIPVKDAPLPFISLDGRGVAEHNIDTPDNSTNVVNMAIDGVLGKAYVNDVARYIPLKNPPENAKNNIIFTFTVIKVKDRVPVKVFNTAQEAGIYCNEHKPGYVNRKVGNTYRCYDSDDKEVNSGYTIFSSVEEDDGITVYKTVGDVVFCTGGIGGKDSNQIDWDAYDSASKYGEGLYDIYLASYRDGSPGSTVTSEIEVNIK